jgi:hypothetical protein
VKDETEPLTNQPTPQVERSPPAPPRAVAISGLIFAVLFVIGLVLIRLAVPADPNDPGAWLASAGVRSSVRTALNLIPISGVAFLWFMGVLRNRIGLKEDRFFATVFLGSGILFTGMLFVSSAVASGLLDTFGTEGSYRVDSATYAFARRTMYVLMNVYAVKMAAVFMFVTSSIGLRTSFLPCWLAYVGFAVGLVLLLEISEFAWIALIFPMWVLLVSAYVLIASPPYEGGAGGVAGT